MVKLNNATIGALRTQFFFYLSACLASYEKKITASTEKIFVWKTEDLN